jgi:hypothetical protein
MKYALSSLLASLVVSLPALASAQDIDAKGNMIFSAERMMGITASRVDWEAEGVEVDNDWTTFSFGWREAPSPFDIPRIAFDYLVIDHLSIGGALGFYSIDPDDGGDASGFLLAPRVGYLHAFGRVVGIWPRGGFTYHSGEVDVGPGSQDQHGFALTLECPFTFSPAEHFAFQVGPTFDIDFTGEREGLGPGNTDVDQNYRSFGLNGACWATSSSPAPTARRSSTPVQ